MKPSKRELLDTLIYEHGIEANGILYLAPKGECFTCDRIRQLRKELGLKGKVRK